MKKNLLSFSFLFLLTSISFAQVAVFKSIAFVDSISQPGVKKYGIKLKLDGINVPVVFETWEINNNIYYYGDSIPNLLNSNNTIQDMNSVSFISFAKNANNTTETILEVGSSPFAQNILSFPLISSSTGLNCDGKIHTSLDTSDNHLSNFNLDLDIPGYSIPLSLGPNSLDTLCSGKYWVTVGYNRALLLDSNVLVSDGVSFLIGQYAFPSATGLNVYVNSYNDASSPSCDGKARVSITNSTNSFLCAFDGGSYSSSDSITNLCEGIHSVLVATANDTIGKYFIISDAGSVINNPNSNGIVVDTITYNFTNCNFNYNLPIDSAFLNSYVVIDSNTVFFSWQIWQLGISTTISDTISYLFQTGNNMVSLNIFCGNARSTNTPGIKTFRVNDFAYLSNTVTSLTNKKNNSNFELYPNPFFSTISIKSKDIANIKSIELFNLVGEKIEISYQSNCQEIVLDTEYLKSGFYTISLISQSGQKISYKVIKQ